VQNPRRVAIKATDKETIRLTLKASQTSASVKARVYQCRVKCPNGKVGKRSELNEKTKLVRMGRNTKTNTSAT
jgi:hypothetical protein